MVESTKQSSLDGVLILLGGSSFQGLTLLRKLASEKKKKIVVVNRGNSYWNNESGKLIAENSERITHVKVDRKNSEKFIQNMIIVLLKLTKNGDRIDSIVDFSCFKPAVLADTLNVLNIMRSEGRLTDS